MATLFAIFIVLGIVALVGHGIWLFVAFLFRGGNEPQQPPPVPTGSAPLSGRARVLADLVTTERQVWRFHNDGVIDVATRDKLLEAIAQERGGSEAVKPMPPVAVLPEVSTPPPIPAPAPPPIPPAPRPIPQPLPPPPPVEPRKPLTELLAAFLEERNIRWGELIGGMLIVLCSIALVVSLWSEIAEIPVLKFGIFTAVTAAIFGIGLFAEHRWKLPTTSHGLLIVATLLVPLNFLAIAAFSSTSAPASLPVIGGEIAALLLLGALVNLAGRVITPPWPTLVTISVLGPCVAELLIRRFAAPGIGLPAVFVLGSLPALIYLGSLAAMLARAARWKTIGEPEAVALFISLGVATFAALLSFGLLPFKTGVWLETLRWLSPVVCVMGLPALSCGLFIWRRECDDAARWIRVAGTSVGLAGALLLAGSLALALPLAGPILPIALISFSTLTAVAVCFRIPAAHLAAGAFLVIAYVVGFHLWKGDIGWRMPDTAALLRGLLAANTAAALVPMLVLAMGIAELLKRRWQRDADAFFYTLVGGAAGALSVLLATWHGFGVARDHGATWIYLFHTAAAAWVAWRWQWRAAVWTGAALLLVASVQAFVFQRWWMVQFPWQFALLAHATVGVAAASWCARTESLGRLFSRPLFHAALATSVATMPMIVASASIPHSGLLAWRAGWLAAILLILSVAYRRPEVFAGFQAALAGAVLFAVAAHWPHPLHDPWTLQAQGTALGLLSLFWVAVRRWIKGAPARFRFAEGLLNPPWPAMDRVLAAMLVVLLTLLITRGVWPGIAAEFLAGQEAGLGFVQQHAVSWGAWVFLVTLVAVFAVQARPIWVLFFLAFLCCPLLAAAWTSDRAVASALRWFCAVYFILASVPVWRWRERVPASASMLVLALSAGPVLVLTLQRISAAAVGASVGGPLPASVFARMGEPLSQAGPLVMLTAGLLAYALRERSAHYFLASGITLNFAVTAGFLVWVLTPEPHFHGGHLMQLLELNVVTAMLFAMGWRALEKLGPSPPRDLYLRAATRVMEAICILGAVRIFVAPAELSSLVIEAGSLAGWAALVATALAWSGQRGGLSMETVCRGSLMFVALAACSAGRSYPHAWIAYHVLLGGCASAAFSALRISVIQRREAWANGIGLMALLLALRAVPEDPGRPWWSVAAIVALSVLAAMLAWQTLRRNYVVGAALLANLAATIWWATEFWLHRPGLELVEVNVLALALTGLASMCIEFRIRRLRPAGSEPAFHDAASLLTLFLVAGVVALGLGADAQRVALLLEPAPAWLALAATGALAIATLWDSAARLAGARVYAFGLIAAGMAIDAFNLAPDRLGWTGAIVIAAYSLASAFVLKGRATWLLPPAIGLACAGVILGFWADFALNSFLLRFTAALAVFLHAAALGLMGTRAYRSSLTAGLMGSAITAWAFVTPGGPNDHPINRSVILLAVALSALLVYSFAFPRLIPTRAEWLAAARSVSKWLAALTFALLVLVLALEVSEYVSTGLVRIHPAGIVVVAVVLVAMCAAALAFALQPGRDPLNLKNKGVYVYAGEAFIALICIHVRLTAPWLFHHRLRRYWPLVVMLIAFVGAGLSELFRRRRQLVLAEPLERTGAFLPLLPVFGFWAVSSQVHYSGLMFAAGALYGTLAIMRRSFGYGVFAAIAGNGGLWYFLHHFEGYGFLQHPQLWLIPIAACVLAAAHLNRDKLPPEQITTIRYFSLMLIYVSSTADIFIHGVATSPWLPLVLAALSVAGVMLGIVLRVRAFLFLGSAFLLLALLTMIWHAAANLGWTWLWYIAGIALGLTIIAVFALFEKKRREIFEALGRLKTWQA